MASAQAVATGAFLGQPSGVEIQISSTSELLPDDLIFIVFPFGARGWFKYGSEETFTVVSVDPAGDVHVIDEAGSPFLLPGGTRSELEARLSEITSVSGITVIRPSLGPAGPRDIARNLGLPSGYSQIPVSTWSDLVRGDHVLLGQETGIGFLVRVEDDDPELLVARVVGTESETLEVGELLYFEGHGMIFSPDAAFRGAPGTRESDLWMAGAAVFAAGAAAILAFA